MRGFVGSIALVASLVFATAANAAISSPSDVAGTWSSDEHCSTGSYAYVGTPKGMEKVVYYDGKSQVSPIKIRIVGDTVEVIDDETKYTYRILSQDKLLFIGFTKLSNGLTAKVEPFAWHRCG